MATPARFSFLSFFQSPIPAILDFSGIVLSADSTSRSGFLRRSHRSAQEPEEAVLVNLSPSPSPGSDGDGGEVSIRIGDGGDGDDVEGGGDSVVAPLVMASSPAPAIPDLGIGIEIDLEAGVELEGSGVVSSSSSSHQRHDLQQLAKWLEHIVPFSFLMFLVFIRQHLQGFFLMIWIVAVMFKCDDILQKQTALKGDRKLSVLVIISVISILQVVGVYCWYQNDDLLYPLVMLPPKEVPLFWHAVFVVMVNDTLVRQVAMIFKSLLLMHYKNSRGHNSRRQGQMLTLVEYAILLYRVLLPTPIWYRFFVGNEQGILFSSLITGLYLTFKLTFVVEKVQTLYAALKALSQKDSHYGSHATSEQVNAVGDLCAICQEKMHDPILLGCKHIFCEDCVSEWLESERTCPLCRAVVKPTDLQSFADGSTSLFFQLV